MALDQAYPSSFFLQFNDRNGKPLANGTLKTFLAGDHSMPIQTWTYPGSGVKNPTAITLSEAGRCTLALDLDTAYYFELYDSEGALEGTWDNVTAGGGTGGGSGTANILLVSPDNSLTIQEEIIDGVKVFKLSVNTNDHEISQASFVSNTINGPDWTVDSWHWAELGEGKGERIEWRQAGDDPNLGDIYVAAGSYHYDLTIQIDWQGTPTTGICNLQLGGFDSQDRDSWIPFDLSYNHAEFYHFSGLFEMIEGYEDRPLSCVLSRYGSAPNGLKATVTFCKIFSLDDGKTIVGYDPLALREVSHDSTMTGKGTPTDPLHAVIPESPVQDVLVNGTSVVDENGDANIDLSGYAEKSEIPEVPVQDVTYGGTSVVNAQGVAEIPTPPAPPVNDVTYGGSSVVNASGVAEIPSPPAPPVTDVTVNGVSVVNAQGVAEIPATGLTEVAHDTTLNGKGTPAEPLSVRMEAIVTQITDDIQDAINTLKSRIIYTVGLSCVENTYIHNGNHDTNGVFAKGTLFNPPMDFDLTDDTRIVFSTNQSAGTDTGKLYFAIYQYDASSKEVNWVCNTDNCFNYVKQTGYQQGFHFALMNHKKDGVSKLVSGKLYYLVMFTDNTNFKIAGNDYAATINTLNGGTNLALGALLDSVKNTGTVSPGATTVISSGADIETFVPKITWANEYLTRIFAAITNVTEAPFDGLPNNKVPSNTALANTLPGFTAGASNTSYRSVVPFSNVNITAVEWVDCMPTAAAWAKGHFIYDDDYSHLLSGDGSAATVTDLGQVVSVPGAYIHRIVFSTAIPLQAYTEYKFLCECFTAGTDTLFSWNDPKELIQVSNDGYNPALANMQPYSNVIGKYLKVYDDQNNHWVI